MQLSSRPRLKRALTVLAALIVVSIGVFLLRAPLLTVMARALVVRDPIRHADVIYVMGGNPAVRPVRAAELYRAGYAPAMALALEESHIAALEGIRLHPTIEAAHMLQRHGVPRGAITILRVPGGATSTREEGHILAHYAKSRNFRTVIVVTSELHTRRSRWALRRALDDAPIEIIMAPAINPRVRPHNWWHTEAGMLECASEYIKFVHNLLN